MQISTSSLEQLKTNHIDLWKIDPTQLSELSIKALESILSKNELEDIKRYKNKNALRTTLITRAISRLVLAQYTTEQAPQLNFERNRYGKPELINNEANLRFNISHNNELIIIAICIKDDIGCDIENPLRKVKIEPLSRRYFSKQEHTELCKLTSKTQQQRFFEMWTLKEAFVKATGIGISLGLNTFYFEKSASENDINIKFNDNYPLDQNQPWQFYQKNFKQQLLTICRASGVKQIVNLLEAQKLIEI